MEQKRIAYIPSSFILTQLPVKKPKEDDLEGKVVIYEKIKETSTSKLKCTLEIFHSSGIPFGKYALLIIAHITTTAVLLRNASDTEIMYETIRDYCASLGVAETRKKEVLNQLNRIANMQFRFTERKTETKRDVTTTVDNQERIMFLRNIKVSEKKREGKSFLQTLSYTISKDYIDFTKNHVVPVNYEKIVQMDTAGIINMYTWIVFKNNILSEEDYTFFSYDELLNLFTDGSYLNKTEAKNQIYRNFKTIKEKYYEELNIKLEDPLGIYLKKSPYEVGRYLDTSEGQQLFQLCNGGIKKLQEGEWAYFYFDTVEMVAGKKMSELKKELAILKDKYFETLEIMEEQKKIRVQKTNKANVNVVYLPFINSEGELNGV